MPAASPADLGPPAAAAGARRPSDAGPPAANTSPPPADAGTSAGRRRQSPGQPPAGRPASATRRLRRRTVRRPRPPPLARPPAIPPAAKALRRRSTRTPRGRPMTTIDGPSLQARQMSGTDPEGRSILSVLFKSTFRLDSSGRCTPAEEQLPLTVDVEDDPERPDLIARDTDLFPFKLGTDVVVKGHAYRIPTHGAEVAVQIGHHRATLLVLGDRRCTLSPTGRIVFSDPLPAERIPLRYDRAYGGKDAAAEARLGNPFEAFRPFLSEPFDVGRSSPFVYPRNACGVGYLMEPTREALEAVRLPSGSTRRTGSARIAWPSARPAAGRGCPCRGRSTGSTTAGSRASPTSVSCPSTTRSTAPSPRWPVASPRPISSTLPPWPRSSVSGSPAGPRSGCNSHTWPATRNASSSASIPRSRASGSDCPACGRSCGSTAATARSRRRSPSSIRC